MAAGPTPRPTPRATAGIDIDVPLNPCLAGVVHLVARLQSQGVQRLGVAFSGGADSTAVLLAAHRQWPGHVDALHVNHGMQQAAADFEAHCQRFCEQLPVPLHVSRLRVMPAAGESPEDAARKARYAAIGELCGKFAIKNVALAQHADDQAETLLLALSRGAGLKGLASMPTELQRGGVTYHRPVLDVSGGAIRQWLELTGTGFVDDPTNADMAFTRNRIRHQVLPALAKAFPSFRQTLARTARHAAQAQSLLDQLAQQDVLLVGLPPRIRDLQALAPERQANVLRYWLLLRHQCAPSELQLTELLKQVAACSTRGHRIRLKVGHGFVHRDGKALVWAPQQADTPPPV